MIPHFSGSTLLQPLVHPEEVDCWDFKWLIQDIQSCLDGLPRPNSNHRRSKASLRMLQDRIYAMFRLRSRIPLCCLRHSGLTANHLQLAMEKDCCFAVLAWGFRGCIGIEESATISMDVLGAWISQQRRKHSDAWKVTNIVMRLLLLLESGCKLEYPLPTKAGPKSVLRIMLEMIYDLKHDTAREIFVDSLLRLQLVAIDQERSDSMRSSLRYFLTGTGISDCLGEPNESDAVGWTTMLHEAINIPMYNLVEAVVLNGFEISALDAQGQTAYQCIAALKRDLGSHGNAALDLDRIEALLSQSSIATWTPVQTHAQDQRSTLALPMGWEVSTVSRKVYNRSARRRSKIITHQQRSAYISRHFNSLTLKRPTFSFFSDQRLALGFRKIHLPGQTYYLDLLRFIRPPFSLPSRDRTVNELFSDEWYEQEAKQSDNFHSKTLRHSLEARTRSLRDGLRAVSLIYQTIWFGSLDALYTTKRAIAVSVSHAMEAFKSRCEGTRCGERFHSRMSLRGSNALRFFGRILRSLIGWTLAITFPRQSLNLFLGCVPLSLAANRLGLPNVAKVSLHLISLGASCSVSQTALLVFTILRKSEDSGTSFTTFKKPGSRMRFTSHISPTIGTISDAERELSRLQAQFPIRRTRNKVVDFVNKFTYSVIVPLANIHTELFFITHISSFGITNAMVDFVIAAITWNFAMCSLAVALKVLKKDYLAHKCHIFACLSLMFVVDISASTAISTLLAEVVPAILLIKYAEFWLQKAQSSVGRGYNISLTWAYQWFWDDTREIFGYSLLPDIHLTEAPRPKNFFYLLPIATIALPISMMLNWKLSSEIIEITVGQKKAMQILILYLLIPCSTRLGYFLIGFDEWLTTVSEGGYGHYMEHPSDRTYPPDSSKNATLRPDFFAERYIAPNTHTFVLWAIMYPVISFVRLLEHQPFAFQLPSLDIPRTVLIIVCLINARYASGFKERGRSLTHLFIFCGIVLVLQQGYLIARLYIS
ncbi:hypothetical protein BU23DRAFT_63265 [Bimuria novae-zelandiae CBS 107.79]|uniref:Uncharacterized protein n=1 Tax=Bimuria novae-zelandiae CBS 107.79 TaxID=1447943 RepID=A0A6A5UIA9_9PLEO|nr:hypothetical protein BU23DRAFT_63265 [Bimuria novae-zelandiae CBS 107.79]